MRESDGGDWIKVNDDDIFTNSYSIKDKLKPGKVYEFKVEATNEAGITSNSNMPTGQIVCPSDDKRKYPHNIQKSTMFLALIDIKLDTPKVEVKSGESVLVRWDLSGDLTSHPDIGFTVLYKSDQSPVWSKMPANETSLEINNLKPDLSYLFKVEAKLPDDTLLASQETQPILLTGLAF